MVSISQIGRVGSSTDMALVVSQIEMAMIRMEWSFCSVTIDPDIIVGITMMSLWGVGTNLVSSVAASYCMWAITITATSGHQEFPVIHSESRDLKIWNTIKMEYYWYVWKKELNLIQLFKQNHIYISAIDSQTLKAASTAIHRKGIGFSKNGESYSTEWVTDKNSQSCCSHNPAQEFRPIFLIILKRGSRFKAIPEMYVREDANPWQLLPIVYRA
jgi:hypothetical protein